MQKNDMNISDIRKKFPILSQKVHGKPLVYFDSAATAQMPQMVMDSLIEYYVTYRANVGRGVYSFAEKSTEKYEEARKKVAQFLGAKTNEIAFTCGATHGINLVAQAWAHHLQLGDEIVVSAVEHHSNFLPWQYLAQTKGIVLKIMPVNKDGIVTEEVLQQYLSSKTKLVAVVHSSNLFGNTNDVKMITRLAHEKGAKVLFDAAQSVVHQKIDVKEIGCDFLVFSGHKLFGPTGVGALFVKEEVIPELQITEFGGGMVFSVGEASSIFKEFPHNFEAGTPAIAQAIGLGAAIDFVQQEINWNQLQQHETKITNIVAQAIRQYDDLEIVSFVPEKEGHGHLVTFYSKTQHAHDIATYLNQYGIAVRAGNHCVQLFHQKCGLNASVRASFSVYNTVKEAEFFTDCLKKII